MTIRELINSTVQFYHDYLYTVANENILDWSISYIFLSLVLIALGLFALSIAFGIASILYVEILQKPVSTIYNYGNIGVKKLHQITGSEKLLAFLEKHLGDSLGGLIWGMLVFFALFLISIPITFIITKL